MHVIHFCIIISASLEWLILICLKVVYLGRKLIKFVCCFLYAWILHLVPDMPQIGLPPVEGAYVKQKKTSLTIHWFQCANYLKTHIHVSLKIYLFCLVAWNINVNNEPIMLSPSIALVIVHICTCVFTYSPYYKYWYLFCVLQYYLKTGTCKFGATCRFHHPKDKAGVAGRVALNILGYPLRPVSIQNFPLVYM
jgi:hypothetical protein